MSDFLVFCLKRIPGSSDVLHSSGMAIIVAEQKNFIKFSAHSMGSAKSSLGADETMANFRISDKNREQILIHENNNNKKRGFITGFSYFTLTKLVQISLQYCPTAHCTGLCPITGLDTLLSKLLSLRPKRGKVIKGIWGGKASKVRPKSPRC